MVETFEAQGKAFWEWLETNGATLSPAIAFKDYRDENAGRGVVAVKDIKEGDVLFSIARQQLLSSQTSALRKVEGMAQVLDNLTGWNPLILCMMYESQRADSFWKPYFDVLPKDFTTPMFWKDEEMKELEGTDIPAKIGKTEAETMFRDEIEPIIKAHPDIFNPEIHNVELFHICGSLIMAYSFHDELAPKATTLKTKENAENKKEEEEDEESDEEEEETEELLAMVPMADMLNHKTGFNNARLFHEPEALQMRAIKPIAAGDQIYNTYGDLCNADLLRKYGFADENNPFDLCEIDGKLVVEVCAPDQDAETIENKTDFLLEEGVMDDCFVIDTDHDVPPELIIAVHVYRSSAEEFEKMAEKEKLPKPRLTPEAKQLLIQLLEQRLARYPTSLEDDVVSLQSSSSHAKKNAILVRLGEKQILVKTLEKLKAAPVAQKRSNDQDQPRDSKKIKH
ncbi:uncharacterized protein BYT42DRAFT_573524 [Radiomyces spectabilis]|uniref:uncharacterized protein n=1 Tax=Radiomyces spectabilis TaxID=64574 RepID=UPI00221E3B42|nr:uncharacterized protein BYT42DRAFT_573524 [Radiomyces spectabilis]KAI8376131.1 hypothetical protein BYT42DRAFT_573524 [Radiomyces spectabilis]